MILEQQSATPRIDGNEVELSMQWLDYGIAHEREEHWTAIPREQSVRPTLQTQGWSILEHSRRQGYALTCVQAPENDPPTPVAAPVCKFTVSRYVAPPALQITTIAGARKLAEATPAYNICVT